MPRTAAARAAIALGSVWSVALVAYGCFAGVTVLALQRQDSTIRYDRVPAAVELHTDGSIAVLAGGPGVRVRHRQTWSLWAPTVRRTWRGSTLVVTEHCPVQPVVSCSTRTTVTVPAGTPMQAVSSGGGITVTGITADLALSSSAGAVLVTGARGRLQLHSGGGPVTGLGLRSSVVTATSSAGRVVLGFAAAPRSVRTRSSGGRVDVTVPRGSAAYLVRAASSAGSETVRVRTDPDSALVLDVSSSAGSVAVHYPPG